MAYLEDYTQLHYVIYELVLPYNTVCTPRPNIDGTWHTPLMCQEESDAVYSLFFAKNNIPTVQQPSQSIAGKSRLNSTIHRCVTNQSVSTTKTKAGEGLASRGTMSITCQDKKGDPGPINFTEEGTFFGKLLARNILEGKKIISHYYTVTDDNPTPQKVRQTTHYVTSATLSNGQFKLNAKDALKDLEAFSQQFPIPGKVTLTADINKTTVVIPVSDASGFNTDDRFRIGSEIFWVVSKSANDITVKTRGTGATNGTRILYKTNTSEHSKEATLQPCYFMNGTPLADVLRDIFNAVGLADFVDYTKWNDEISQWDGDAVLWGIMSEPEDASDIIDLLLNGFLVDMWLDQDTQKAKVSTNTAWKQPKYTYSEGNDIQNYRVSTSDNTRFSRAYTLSWQGISSGK